MLRSQIIKPNHEQPAKALHFMQCVEQLTHGTYNGSELVIPIKKLRDDTLSKSTIIMGFGLDRSQMKDIEDMLLKPNQRRITHN